MTTLRIVGLFNKDLRGLLQVAPDYVRPVRYDARKLRAHPLVSPARLRVRAKHGRIIGSQSAFKKLAVDREPDSLDRYWAARKETFACCVQVSLLQ
jgi:hypothetical protein